MGKKNTAIIIAWSYGNLIQYRDPTTCEWMDVDKNDFPSDKWLIIDDWRIKPKEIIKHRDSEIIIAWANGYKIEHQSPTTFEWSDTPNICDLGIDDSYRNPHPLHPSYDLEWRVKHEQEPELHKHKNSEIIAAWANGLDIEYQSQKIPLWFPVPNINDLDIADNFFRPSPIHPDYSYLFNWRIKP